MPIPAALVAIALKMLDAAATKFGEELGKRLAGVLVDGIFPPMHLDQEKLIISLTEVIDKVLDQHKLKEATEKLEGLQNNLTFYTNDNSQNFLLEHILITANDLLVTLRGFNLKAAIPFSMVANIHLVALQEAYRLNPNPGAAKNILLVLESGYQHIDKLVVNLKSWNDSRFSDVQVIEPSGFVPKDSDGLNPPRYFKFLYEMDGQQHSFENSPKVETSQRFSAEFSEALKTCRANLEKKKREEEKAQAQQLLGTCLECHHKWQTIREKFQPLTVKNTESLVETEDFTQSIFFASEFLGYVFGED